MLLIKLAIISCGGLLDGLKSFLCALSAYGVNQSNSLKGLYQNPIKLYHGN